MFDDVRDPSIVLEKSKRVISANQPAQQLLEASERDLIGQRLWEDLPEARAILDHADDRDLTQTIRMHSDRYFELKNRAERLAEKSHSIAYALMRCAWCSGAGSVAAATFSNVKGLCVKATINPLELLPCVCTVGWPHYKQGDDYDG